MHTFETTVDFINNHVNPTGFPVGTIIYTEGYSTKGGVGRGRWSATGNVIAPSQDPLALNDTKLSDASGNEYFLALDQAGIIDLNCLGGTSAAYINIATTAGYQYSQGLSPVVPQNDIVNIDTVASLEARADVSVGEAFMLGERAKGIFRSKTGLVANGWDIIQSTASPGVGGIQYKLDVSQGYILEQYGVKVGGNASDNSDAILQVIADSGGSFTTNLKGTVEFNKPITITGSGRTININNDLIFLWVGVQNAIAWRFGDGVASTRSIEVHNLKLTDGSATAGVNTLLHLHRCVACQFYSLLLTSNGTRTNGIGLKIEFAFINDFYAPVIANLYDSIHLLSDTNSTSFFGINIEGCQNNGLTIPIGTNTNRNAVFGGTIEGVSNNALKLSAPSTGLSFYGTYFEANDTHALFDMSAAEVVPVNFVDCRFKAPTTALGAIVVTGPARIIAERCNSDGQSLFHCTNSAAWIKCTDNISDGGNSEFTAGSVGNLISSKLDGAAIKYSKLRTMEFLGYKVPVMQTGSVASLAAGSSTTVVFPTAFLNIPFVATQLGEHASLVSLVALPSKNQVTFRNRGSVAIAFSWAAYDIGNLN